MERRDRKIRVHAVDLSVRKLVCATRLDMVESKLWLLT